jgi:hypothetical protein
MELPPFATSYQNHQVKDSVICWPFLAINTKSKDQHSLFNMKLSLFVGAFLVSMTMAAPTPQPKEGGLLDFPGPYGDEDAGYPHGDEDRPHDHRHEEEGGLFDTPFTQDICTKGALGHLCVDGKVSRGPDPDKTTR